jgi:hypothetical protein
MAKKASSLSARNFLHRIGDSVRGRSEGTKDGDPHDGTVGASPVMSAIPSQNIAGRSMTGMDTSQPAQSSPVPVSMAPQSPEQVASSPGPSASSGQQPATTVSEVVPPPIASPAPTASRAQLTTSDTVPFTSSSLPERLWNQAYEDLRAKENKWVDAYERILSRELKGGNSSSTDLESQKNEIEHSDPRKRRSQMEELVQAGLKKTEGEDKVKQVIGEALQGVLSVKDIIGSALQPVPQAALAWTGVCFALQVGICRPKITTMRTDLPGDTRKPYNGNESQSRRDRLYHRPDGLVL